MSKNLHELCSLLVEDVYGGLPATVFKALAQWGRLTLRVLFQRCDIPSQHVRHGLIVLIQQNLIFHSSADVDDQAYYEVDWDGAYELMRVGKMVSIIEERYGSGAAQVISNLLQLGHARVGDLEDAYHFTSRNSTAINSAAEHINGEGLPNGVEKNHVVTKPQDKKITTREQLHSVLYQLLTDGFITKVHDRSYLSNADYHNHAVTLLKQGRWHNKPTNGPKAKAEFAADTREMKRKWREEEDRVSGDIFSGTVNGSSGPPRKRIKINGTTSNGSGRHGGTDFHGPEVILQRDIVLRPRSSKFIVAMRSMQIEQFASRFCGDVTAKVYGTLLQLLEKNVLRCRDDLEEEKTNADDDDDNLRGKPTATTFEVLEALDLSLDLSEGLESDCSDGLANGTNHDGHAFDSPRVKSEDGGDEEMSSMKSRNQRLLRVEAHLKILMEHPRGFVEKIGTRGKGEWTVRFDDLTRNLQGVEVENVVAARFGSVAARVVRVLKAKGRLDEKLVSTYALLRKKDICAVLNPVQEAGLIETQEVPKDAGRQPSRAVYLWYFDPERVMKVLVSDTLKAMARTIQRIQVQKDAVKDVIEKAERLDVVGHEDEYLTQSDKNHLRRWREEEEKLLAQLMRMDDMVALLRDF